MIFDEETIALRAEVVRLMAELAAAEEELERQAAYSATRCEPVGADDRHCWLLSAEAVEAMREALKGPPK